MLGALLPLYFTSLQHYILSKKWRFFSYFRFCGSSLTSQNLFYCDHFSSPCLDLFVHHLPPPHKYLQTSFLMFELLTRWIRFCCAPPQQRDNFPGTNQSINMINGNDEGGSQLIPQQREHSGDGRKTPVTPLQKTGTQKEKGFCHLSDGFQFDETVNV